MNLTRLAFSTVAAFAAYFAVGGVFLNFPGMRDESAKHSAIFRPPEAMKGTMPVGMIGILLAIGVAAVFFARIHPAGAGVMGGLEFGALLAVFALGTFVLHNYMILNVSGRLTMLQAVAYSAEWIAVGIVISLVYRG